MFHLFERTGKQRLFSQLLDSQQPGTESIVDIVVVVCNCIRQVGNLCFEAWLLAVQEALADIAQLPRICPRAVLENAFPRLEHQVEARKIGVLRLEFVDDAQRLQVVLEAAEFPHAVVERILAGMAERRVPEIVREADCLGQRFV